MTDDKSTSPQARYDDSGTHTLSSRRNRDQEMIDNILAPNHTSLILPASNPEHEPAKTLKTIIEANIQNYNTRRSLVGQNPAMEEIKSLRRLDEMNDQDLDTYRKIMKGEGGSGGLGLKPPGKEEAYFGKSAGGENEAGTAMNTGRAKVERGEKDVTGSSRSSTPAQRRRSEVFEPSGDDSTHDPSTKKSPTPIYLKHSTVTTFKGRKESIPALSPGWIVVSPPPGFPKNNQLLYHNPPDSVKRSTSVDSVPNVNTTTAKQNFKTPNPKGLLAKFGEGASVERSPSFVSSGVGPSVRKNEGPNKRVSSLIGNFEVINVAGNSNPPVSQVKRGTSTSTSTPTPNNTTKTKVLPHEEKTPSSSLGENYEVIVNTSESKDTKTHRQAYFKKSRGTTADYQKLASVHAHKLQQETPQNDAEEWEELEEEEVREELETGKMSDWDPCVDARYFKMGRK